MKLSFLPCLLFLAFMTMSFGTTVDRGFPTVNVKTLNGELVDIQDYIEEGKVTIVSFWATWCSPCKRELDAIMDFYPEWRDELEVNMIAITTDNARSVAKVPGIVTAKGWEYTILQDYKQELQSELSFQTIPQTFVLDRSGNIVYSHNGYNPGDEYELDDLVRELSE